MIRVMLVDDHHIVRAGIKRILNDVRGVTIVAEASSAEDALHIIHEKNIDVVLMDIHMPGAGGLEGTRRIVGFNPKIKVLVLTGSSDEIFPGRFLKNGAMGYLTKGCSAEELVSAIKQVHGGQRYLSLEVAQQMALKRFDDSQSPFELLSERELQVMLMITRGQKALEIAAQLHLSTKTINTYRYRIFEKLGIKSDVELTHLAIRYGVIDSKKSQDNE